MLDFDPIRGRFFAQVLPKFLVVRSAGIVHQRIAMPVPESKEDRAAVPVISQVLPREPDGRGMKKRFNGAGGGTIDAGQMAKRKSWPRGCSSYFSTPTHE